MQLHLVRPYQVLSVLALSGLGGCLAPATVATIHATQEGSARVELDGEPFATVHFAAEPRPFVHPLYAAGGMPVTRSWPMAVAPGEAQDHPHHQSFWFAHGDVNGFNFWHHSGRDERIELDGEVALLERPCGAKICARYRWLAEEQRLVCTEERWLTFHHYEEGRYVDVETTLTPAGEPLVLGDTKEGILALRLHPALRLEGEVAAGSIVNSEGVRDGECWGKRAAWVEYSGPIDGREVGVAIFDHPSNVRHPTWWHARGYGLVAANPFGIGAFEGQPQGTGDLTVEVGESITFRYRILIHTGEWTPARVQAAYEHYTGG